MLALKTKKSAGVKVTAPVHKLISQGNLSRSIGDWGSAADAYRKALELDPSLSHIWVQLGHAANEAGRWHDSEQAYQEAIVRGAPHGETLLHLGHMLKRSNQPIRSARAYLDAARLGDEAALNELNTRVGRLLPLGPALLRAAIKNDAPVSEMPDMARTALNAIDTVRATIDDQDIDSILAELSHRLAPASPTHAPGELPVVSYDISDLIAHFRNHRLPTGIQRVQIEVLSRAIFDTGSISRICCFVDGNEYLTEIPIAIFQELAQLARSGTDANEPGWLMAVTRLFIHLAIASPYEFTRGESLVNLGTSWWIYNYFLFIRNAKITHDIRFSAVVFDLIPLLATEHCLRGISEDYVGWLVGAFRHTDHFFAISDSTAQDLVRAAERLGHEGMAERVTVIPLDADFRSPANSRPDPGALARWNLVEEGYALFVSTIESRKNHVLVLDAWAQMLREGQKLPQLVFVGRNGWLNDQVFARLSSNPELRQKVTIIERASDDELALLYGNCLITVYPSLYEGWGLPVTESLCYGKVPLVADNSSLPEAGGEFAVFFESNSVASLVEAVTKVIDAPEWRKEREHLIKKSFAPRPWSRVADQTIAVAKKLVTEMPPTDPIPAVEPGRYYSLHRYKGVRIWSGLESGEIFRTGEGWHWPDEKGSRTRPDGGDLSFRLPDREGPWRLFIRLTGLESDHSPYEIRLGDTVISTGSLRAGENRWAQGATFSAPAGAQVTFHIRGLVSEGALMLQGGGWKPRIASIGCIGFYIFQADDRDSYERLIESEALNRLDEIDAYRENGAWRTPAAAI